MKTQRLRLRLSLGQEAASLSHRELVSVLDEACKVAGLSVYYPESKRPAPQISIAAPLPLGATSDWELVDIFLTKRVEPKQAQASISETLPEGLRAIAVEEVGLAAPSLTSRLRWADYEVRVPAGELTVDDMKQAIARLLAADTLPSEYRRETKVRRYDLRPLIIDLWLEGERDDCFVIAMRLWTGPEGTARSHQVVLALGLPEAPRIHRRRLHLEDHDAAVLAFRRLARFEDVL